MLTDTQIRSLPIPEHGNKRYWDHNGLMLQVMSGGTKTFFLVQGKGRKLLKIGRYGIITLAEARARVKQIIAAQTLGTYSEPSTTTVLDALKLFHVRCDERNKASTAKETKRLLSHLKPIHGRPIETVQTRQLLSVIDAATKSLSERRHLFVACRTFFRWASRERLIKLSPLHDLQPPGKAGVRDRVLTDDELAAVYNAAIEMGHPFGFIVLICIHTALRINETAHLRWSYISKDTITIPKELTKNSREHVLPNLLTVELQDIPKTNDYLFLGARGRPFNQWDRYKKRMDELSGVTNWTLHDLRRTAASKMAEWQCGPPHVIERILNHVTGTMSPIARTYNRHTYLKEMRDCMTLYQNKLVAIVSAK